MAQDLQAKLKQVVWQALAEFQVPGAAIAIRINNHPVLELGVGYQDQAHITPLPANASFYIYSITKILLAAATLHCVSEGRLALDVPIQNYLSDFSWSVPITLRQLLSHTSGLPDYGGVSAYGEAVKAKPHSPWSAATFLDLAQTQGSQFAPGTRWSYSNIGYLLIKCILEQVTHSSIQALLENLIFRPLSLQQTFVPTTLDDVNVLIPGFTAFFGHNQLQDMSHLYHPGWVSHGVVISTAPELAKIIDSLFNTRILNSSLIEQMRQPVHEVGQHPPFKKLGYGLGLFVDSASPYGATFGHTGEGPGYSAAAFHFFDLAGAHTTIAALANQDQPNFGLKLVYKLAQAIVEQSGERF